MEEKVTIVNKLVKAASTADGIDNSGIIPFMYPNYVLREEIFYDKSNDVLYMGKGRPGLKQELEDGTNSFIAVVSTGLYDVDFTNREVIIKVLYSKWDKEPNEDTQKMLMDMTEHDFWDFFKKFWVLGSSKLDKTGAPMLKLFRTLGKQRYDIMKLYFELRESYDDNVIFSSLLSFMEKAMDPESYEHLSGGYVKALKDFNKLYGDNIRALVRKAYMMKSSSSGEKEYRTIWLLYQLGKGNLI